jgi:hypothetical protein
MSKHAEHALSLLPTPELRAAITRLSVHTPDVIYGSADFDPEAEEAKELRGIGTALLLIAARGHEEIKIQDTMTLNFTGLSSSDVPYGDWQVSITRINTPSADISSGEITSYERKLAELPTSELRQVLSRLSALTCHSLYPVPDFGADLKNKVIENKESLGPSGQAGMFLCSILKSTLSPGETWRKDLFSMERATGVARAWHIDVTRYSL